MKKSLCVAGILGIMGSAVYASLIGMGVPVMPGIRVMPSIQAAPVNLLKGYRAVRSFWVSRVLVR